MAAPPKKKKQRIIKIIRKLLDTFKYDTYDNHSIKTPSIALESYTYDRKGRLVVYIGNQVDKKV